MIRRGVDLKERAVLFVPPLAEYPHHALKRGLQALGYEVVTQGDGDLLVTWSPWKGSPRYALQDRFSRENKPVIVVENGWLSPVDTLPYYQIALDGWNGTGRFPAGSGARLRTWTRLPNRLPWRTEHHGRALVIGQRGHNIDPRTAKPGWETTVQVDAPHVLRRGRNCETPLVKQLEWADEVHVWNSSIAAWAIHFGIPVVQHGPNLMVSHLTSRPGEPLSRGDRLPEFERLAWAQWSEAEIMTGEPFKRVLQMATL